ncbi:hypothetical protein ACA910_000999 [Epithemia clementina (nom. ined.)]
MIGSLPLLCFVTSSATNEAYPTVLFAHGFIDRREFATASTTAALAVTIGEPAIARKDLVSTRSPNPAVLTKDSRRSATGSALIRVRDPNTYEALVYAPLSQTESEKLPLLLVLHGAGNNDQSAWSLADINGEHSGLAPSLLASQRAPEILANTFCVVAPYVGDGKRSFYEEPRSKLLRFLDWVLSDEGKAAGCPQNIDPCRICLFGFSDGATVAVELATTLRFQCVVVAAYGFTGTLPKLGLERLERVPMWVFHSADDVIFPVRCSDQLVQSLQTNHGSFTSQRENLVRYSRYSRDPEGCVGSFRGHCVGITASKNPDIYDWMLSVSSEQMQKSERERR